MNQPPNNHNNIEVIQSKFHQFIDFFLPIKKSEIPKFSLITVMMFCILFNQNLIRAEKDTLVISHVGPEALSYLKFWGVLPASILMTVIYVRLINSLRAEKVFYLILGSFLAFFALFAFVIIPNQEMLFASEETVNTWVISFPHLKWFIKLAGKWGFAIFYIVAELWPNVVLALLFWQFVNKVTDVEQSRRFYPVFAFFSQTGLIISGEFLTYLPKVSSSFISCFNLNSPRNIISVQILLTIAIILGGIAILCFWLLNHPKLNICSTQDLQFQQKKQKLSLKDSIKMVLSSKYIGLIATLLICYGLVINLVEGPWKAKANLAYPDPDDFTAFVGSYLSKTGVFTILFVVFSSNIIRRLGWFAGAIITPLFVLITGALFFFITEFNMFKNFAGIIAIGGDPLLLAVTIGAWQNVFSKSSKYTFFDATKEMSYVPLDDELKTKGKAAADVIATKFGKSFSALIQSMIFMIAPNATYNTISFYIMIIFFVVCFIWLYAVRCLSKEYNDLCSK